jgi:hypothetical protein
VVQCRPCLYAISTAASQIDSGSRVRRGFALRHSSNRWLSFNKSSGTAVFSWAMPHATTHRRIGREIHVGPLSLEVVRYIPEHGCTVKLTAYPDGGGSPLVFYGKTYCGEEGERTYHTMSALWNSEARTGGTLRMAQPLAYEPAHFILWQSAVEGPTLASFEKSGPELLPYLRAAGQAAMALHSQFVHGLPRMTAAQMGFDLQVAELHLRRVPTLAGRVSRLTSQLLEQAPEWSAGRTATLHGDLHAKNMPFGGEGDVVRRIIHLCLHSWTGLEAPHGQFGACGRSTRSRSRTIV